MRPGPQRPSLRPPVKQVMQQRIDSGAGDVAVGGEVFRGGEARSRLAAMAQVMPERGGRCLGMARGIPGGVEQAGLPQPPRRACLPHDVPHGCNLSPHRAHIVIYMHRSILAGHLWRLM